MRRLALAAVLLALWRPCAADDWWRPDAWASVREALAGLPKRPPVPRAFPNSAEVARACGAEPRLLRLVVVGDSEPGHYALQRALLAPREGLERQLPAMDELHPDLIVHLGDFVPRGTREYYDRFRQLRARAQAPMVVLIGNHDRSRPAGPADKSLYDRTFGARDFAFDCGPARLVMLDDSDKRLRPDQLRWLDAVLETPRRKLVFLHIPPIYLKHRLEPAATRGYPDLDERPVLGWTADVGFFREGSDEFGRLMRKHAVDRVYMGHIHALARAEQDGVRYVLTGGGGSPLYPLPAGYPSDREPHFLWVTVDARGVDELVRAPEGLKALP